MTHAELASGPRPSNFGVWLTAVRALSLTAAAIPVLLGMAVAVRDGYFAPARLVLALIGAVAIQAGTNLINDYYDYQSGADLEQTLGPSMAIQRGLLTPEAVWRGGVVAFSIGAAIGLVLVYLCGWPILWLGIPSIAAGYFYTARPVALAYIALGELTVFIFMGPVIVLGTYFVMAGHFAWSAAWPSIALGFLVAGILHANNVRDIDTDTRHNKRTMANLLGRKGANRELAVLDILAFATTLSAIGLRAMPLTALISLIAIPRARDQLRIVYSTSDPKKLNLALLRSVQLHMEFGLLMTIAYLGAAALRW